MNIINFFRRPETEIFPKNDPIPTENATAVWHAPTCTSCGAVAATSTTATHQPSLRLQYVPVPVLVPVPFPVPYNEQHYQQNSGIQLYGLDTLSMFGTGGIHEDPRLRLIQQRLVAAMNTLSTQSITTLTANQQSITENRQQLSSSILPGMFHFIKNFRYTTFVRNCH